MKKEIVKKGKIFLKYGRKREKVEKALQKIGQKNEEERGRNEKEKGEK